MKILQVTFIFLFKIELACASFNLGNIVINKQKGMITGIDSAHRRWSLSQDDELFLDYNGTMYVSRQKKFMKSKTNDTKETFHKDIRAYMVYAEHKNLVKVILQSQRDRISY